MRHGFQLLGTLGTDWDLGLTGLGLGLGFFGTKGLGLRLDNFILQRKVKGRYSQNIKQ